MYLGDFFIIFVATNVTAFYYGIAFVVFINKRDLNNVR